MPNPSLHIDSAVFERRLHELAAHGAVGSTGIRRLVYTEAWTSAMALCRKWAVSAGLETRTDAVGNLWARLPGRTDGPVIVTGSHIDSQRNGGRFDGALGAIGGILALETLGRQIGQPRQPLEAVVLCEEEGSRFPQAGFWGSRAAVGKISATDPDEIRDQDGISIGDAMRATGLDPDRIPEANRDDIDAFLELHVEQGPICEDAGVAVGIVDAITGIAHFEAVLTGEQNHAGACPMDLRRDPMAGFAEIAGRLIDHAHRLGRPAVTTVGRCEVDPGGPAVVPRQVTFTIDARHPDSEKRKTMYAVHENLVRETAARRGLAIDFRTLIDHEPCQCDAGLVMTLQQAAANCGIRTITLPSGAGHDTQQMSGIARVAMIFVRSRGGLSHTPEEFSTTEDCVDGIRVLAEALRLLAY